MDPNTVVTGMQQLTPLQLLEHVDAFYNNAWIKLIIYITSIFAIVGILVPLFVQWLQRRFFLLRENKIESNLKIYCDQLKSTIASDINDKFRQEKEKIEKELENMKKDLDNKTSLAKAMVFHAQGRSLYVEKDYFDALKSYLCTIEGYIIGNDQLNLQTALKIISECMDKIYCEDLENLKYDGCDIDKTIKLLGDNNDGDKLTSFIRDLKKSYGNLKQRKRV